MSCHSLLQGIISKLGIKPGSLALQADSLPSEPHDVLVYVYYQLQQMDHLVRDVANGGGYAGVKAESIHKISVPSFQFCCEPKTAL